MPKRLIRVACVLAVLSVLSAAAPWALAAAPRVPNLAGDYVGLFQAPSEEAPQELQVAPLDQDARRRLRGAFLFGSGDIPLSGTVGAGGACTCIGQGEGGRMQCRMGWESFGNGAGALFGTGRLTPPGSRGVGDLGSIVCFRPFAAAPAAAFAFSGFDVRGAYAGSFRNAAGAQGSLVAGITDGTSNTIRIVMTFQSARATISYACVGDVAADGQLAAIGTAPDGTVAVIRGYIEQDNLNREVRLQGTAQFRTAAGRPLETNSIIAILIG